MKTKHFLGYLLILVLMGCSSGESQIDLLTLDIDNYKPIETFLPAYEAINNRQGLETNKDYDIEKTVRILNAMELAQVRSKNFQEYLDYMAHQDYTGVAPDVLEAKRKLFPVLEYTYELWKKDEQLSDAWMLVRGAARGGQSFLQNTSPTDILRITQGDIFALMGMVTGEDAGKMTDEAFAQYEKDKELKSKIQEDLNKLKASYRQYLEDYTPIYKKYMDEYNRLCLEKDQTYLDLYAGRTEEALKNAQKILDKYPDNAEAMLLKSMGLIILGGAEQVKNGPAVIERNDSSDVDLPTEPAFVQTMNSKLQTAYATLQQYNDKYPDRTAPALVLEGLLYQSIGDNQAAKSRFDQASTQYPRQAAQLTDMLDSYNTRNYLNKTAEGQYLRRLYASTMMGYGLFSPNLLKAKHYAEQGDMKKSQEEIFDHFFRRGNQGIYDGLLDDMQFCEENLYAPFKSLLLEQSYIDVEITPESEWFFWQSDDVINVKIRNRSDLDLENVRIFLCIHYTDMHYKNEYDIVKVPKTLNRIDKHSTADLDTVVLRYPGKTCDDIAHIRAIAMTDDRICWVDDVKYKTNRVLDLLQGNGRDSQSAKAREEYLSNYSLNPQKLQRTIKDGLTVLPPEEDPAEEKGWWDKMTGWFSHPDNNLKIELPRVMVMTNPVFSLGAIDGQNSLTPRENEIYGTSIRLVFDYEPEYEEVLSLFIYSEVANYKVEILYRGKDSVVQSVDILS